MRKLLKLALLIASFMVVGFASTEAMADTTFSEVVNMINLLPLTGPLGHFPHPPVPEADTWAMIGVGVALIGYQLRRRKNKK